MKYVLMNFLFLLFSFITPFKCCTSCNAILAIFNAIVFALKGGFTLFKTDAIFDCNSRIAVENCVKKKTIILKLLTMNVRVSRKHGIFDHMEIFDNNVGFMASCCSYSK